MVDAGVSSGNDVAPMLDEIHTESGTSLLELTEASPVLLVFLRHFGCSFCRKAISDVAELAPELSERGVRPVFVHLGTPEIAKAHFDFYNIGDVERICDPDAKIYRNAVFGLGRVNPWWHLVNPIVWHGWLSGALFKHGVGKIETDGHQMPGIFLLKGSMVVRRFVYKTIADQPKYLKLVG